MTRTQKVWIGIGISFIALATAGLLARDWLGPRAAQLYLTFFYKNSVNMAFRESFDPLDAPLTKLGITFRGTPAAEARCEVKGYDTLLMTNSCDIIQQSNSIALNDTYITEWKRGSAELENTIIKRGWQKTWDPKQNITALFDNRTNPKAMSVNYERKQGDTICILSIVYTPALSPTVFFANRECHRNVPL